MSAPSGATDAPRVGPRSVWRKTLSASLYPLLLLEGESPASRAAVGLMGDHHHREQAVVGTT
jgi:hypothetical protein